MTDLLKIAKSIVVHFAHICAYGVKTVKFLYAIAYPPTILGFPGFRNLTISPGIRSICPGILTFWLAIMVYIMFAIFQSFV